MKPLPPYTKFLFINLAFLALNVLFGDQLIYLIKSIAIDGTTNRTFGIFIIVIMILEVWAIAQKNKLLKTKETSISGFAWIMHMLTGMLLIMTAADAISTMPFEGDNPVLGIAILFGIILNIIVFGFLASDANPKPLSPQKDLFVEAIIIIYNFLIYTGIWGGIASSTGAHISTENIALAILYTFCAFIIFMIFYASLNMLTWLEVSEQKAPSTYQKTAAILSFVIVVATALLKLF